MEQTLGSDSPSASAAAGAQPTAKPLDTGKTSGPGKQIEDIYIEVTPDGPEPNPPPSVDTHVDCTLRQKGSSKGASMDGNRVVIEEGAGPFCVRLKLKDWLEWRKDDPLWVAKDGCPDSAQMDHGQIWLDKNPSDNTISFLDMNVGPGCTLHYRMNFMGNMHCDPIVDNGGGGKLTRF